MAPVAAAFPISICHRCGWMRLVPTEHSTFLRCTAPAMPRYPRQPVLRCASNRPVDPPDEVEQPAKSPG
jgi:hypothetical protein